MSDRYILEGHKAVPCDDLMQWAKWYEKADRHVALEERDGVKVSTIFLGLDHSFGLGLPVLFETMVFGGKYDQDQERYQTWRDAEIGHREICKKVFNEK